MSFVLTAAKKSVKPKSSKPRKKKKTACPLRTVPADKPPPVSTEKVAVWHWIMDERTTTVMFTKETGEVWCNGETMETRESFDEDSCGLRIDFIIFIEESQIKHPAHIIGKHQKNAIAFQLYVDGYMIYENKTPGNNLQELPPYMAPQKACNDDFMQYDFSECSGFNYPPDPPTYAEAVAAAEYEDKKSK